MVCSVMLKSGRKILEQCGFVKDNGKLLYLYSEFFHKEQENAKECIHIFYRQHKSFEIVRQKHLF